MTLEEQNGKRNTTRAQTARPSDQRPAALKREKQESARSEASDNDSIPHLLDSDPLFDLRAWRRSNPHGLFRNKLKELQNWLYDFLPDAPPQQIQEWLTYYEHRFDTLSRIYPELLGVFHVDPESPQEQEFRFCEMIRPLLRSELARHDTKGAGGASQAGARLTETKSESVSVHDKKAEPVQETVGQTMASQAPSCADTATDRRGTVDAYIDEVFKKTGKRITRTDIWKAARYKSRTEFERWERKDSKRPNKAAHQRFTRILSDKPHLK